MWSITITSPETHSEKGEDATRYIYINHKMLGRAQMSSLFIRGLMGQRCAHWALPVPSKKYIFRIYSAGVCNAWVYSAADVQPPAGVYSAWQVLASSQNNAATVGCGHYEALCSAPAGGHGLILQCGIIWPGEFRTCYSKQDWQYHESQI